jgi:hypothetical protein
MKNKVTGAIWGCLVLRIRYLYVDTLATSSIHYTYERTALD